MIYNFSVLKSTFLNQSIFVENRDLAAQFKLLFNEQDLFDKGLVSSFCIFEDKIHIGKNSLIPIIDYVNKSFSIELQVSTFKKYAKFSKEKLEFFDVSSHEEFKIIFNDIEQKRIAIRQEKKAAFAEKFEAPLPISLEGKKILSLDFEYRDSSKKIEIFEMGVTISVDGLVSHFHYTTTKKRMETFKFGTSVLVTHDDFAPILINHLKDVDFIIGHALPIEFKILRHCNFDMSQIEHIKCIDTSSVIYNECESIAAKSAKNHYISLKDALKALKVNHFSSYLHNAGNDSAYTLELLHKLVDFKIAHFALGGVKKFKIV